MLTVCSCSKSITNKVSDEPYKLGIYNQALSIFDDFIKSKPEDSRVKERDIIEELNLKKISNDYFLIFVTRSKGVFSSFVTHSTPFCYTFK